MIQPVGAGSFFTHIIIIIGVLRRVFGDHFESWGRNEVEIPLLDDSVYGIWVGHGLVADQRSEKKVSIIARYYCVSEHSEDRLVHRGTRHLTRHNIDTPEK